MQLVETAENPVPNGAVCGQVTTRDGARLRFARWRATASKRQGTVCVFPGRAEFIEKYFEVVSDLRRRGFAVAVLDWRGQGGSQRLLKNPRKGHIDSFSQFDSDLACFMDEVVLPDCPPPYFALAHSMGGCVLLRNARRSPNWFERIVTTAPMVELAASMMPNRATRVLLEVLGLGGLGDLYVPGGVRKAKTEIDFGNNPFTSDETRFRRVNEVIAAAPHLAIGGVTLGWVVAAVEAMSEIADPDFAASVRVPVLMIAAGDERIVSNRAIEALAFRLKTGSHIVLPGARHEILMEREMFRGQFWAAFDAFVPGSPVYREKVAEIGR